MDKFSCLLISSILLSCQGEPETFDEIMHGSISYPFASTAPIGINHKSDPFVIRSISEGTEYVIEIPLSAIANQKQSSSPKSLPNPNITDQELIASMPNAAQKMPSQSSLTDRTFGVGPSQKPRQAPSYTLSIAKINQFYKNRQYEYALVKINHILTFYPNSVRLHKMKGSTYIKLREFKLAEKAWIKALELAPSDKVLRQGVARLKGRIEQSQTAKNSEIPTPTQNQNWEPTTENQP